MVGSFPLTHGEASHETLPRRQNELAEGACSHIHCVSATWGKTAFHWRQIASYHAITPEPIWHDHTHLTEAIPTHTQTLLLDRLTKSPGLLSMVVAYRAGD
jgi:hypothetical protein